MYKIFDNKKDTPDFFDIPDTDIFEAMKDIPGYLDITPKDFKMLYRAAFKHAIERVTEQVKARDIMTDKVIFVKKDTPSKEVAKMMAAHAISGVPVVDNEKRVIGIISETDFLFQMGDKNTKSFMDVVQHCLRNKGCVAITMRRQKAQDIMSTPVITVRPNTPILDIAKIFTEKNIGRVPVTDKRGELLGIVARADLLQSSLLIKPNLIAS